jgi:hypothetical protein
MSHLPFARKNVRASHPHLAQVAHAAQAILDRLHTSSAAYPHACQVDYETPQEQPKPRVAVRFSGSVSASGCSLKYSIETLFQTKNTTAQHDSHLALQHHLPNVAKSARFH